MQVQSASKTDELGKVQQHLTLLRSEYVKLQTRFHALERTHALSMASATSNGASFAERIMKTVSGLFGQKRYSDLEIDLGNVKLPGHKFVLAARSDVWKNLESVDSIDWSHLEPAISRQLLKWIYSDVVEVPDSFDQAKEDFYLRLMQMGKEFNLKDLLRRCEETLLSSVTLRNCIRFYSIADEIGAETLRNHCSELITAHWDDFGFQDFKEMKPSLLYKMLITKTKYPLHAAIKLHREDVVFLYLIEFGQELDAKVNASDDQDALPLGIALATKQETLAVTLLEHKAKINQTNSKGLSLLQVAVGRGDQASAVFLLDHGADPNAFAPDSGDTVLHEAARHETMASVAVDLVNKGARINAQNNEGLTPLHLTIECRNKPVFDVLLQREQIDCDVKSSQGFPPLYDALRVFSEDPSYAKGLVAKGASADVVCGNKGNSLLHHCALAKFEDAAIFLLDANCDLNRANTNGETALHVAAKEGLSQLAKAMLDSNSIDANVQTIMNEDTDIFRESALHLAIVNKQVEVINVILAAVKSKASNQKPNLNLKNSKEQTPIGLALSSGLHEVAVQLLQGGANVNVTNADGLNLLHQAIMDSDEEGSLFLLQNGAETDLRTSKGETPIELAITHKLPRVVENLCQKGADMTSSSQSDPPLWLALGSDEEIASILVRHGVDTDCWAEGPDECQQTLLHRAIDENNEAAACFLIRSGCDVNSPRQPGPNGQGGDEAHDLATPLHLCCQWGLEQTVNALLEHGAQVNAKDVDGKTPLHLAIENAHIPLIELLLSNAHSSGLDLSVRDKSGSSAFATAMTFKNNKAAQMILNIEPQAAEFYDSRGRNFLHTAVMKNDFESVLFLLSIHVNVNSRTQDSNLVTPLLLAVQVGNEMIVRNLLLAGASVSAVNSSKQTALHLAAESNLPEICEILLQEGIDFAGLDAKGNNALHVAVQEGHLDVVRVLLTQCHIDAEALNNKGRAPLHVLAVFGKDNSSAILDVFLERFPNFPINKPDADGSTPLFLAYTKGNGQLCRSLVKAGAVLGTLNNQGVSIFNYQVASKQLLFRLLDFLSQEPKWGEGDHCQECSTKFGLTTRKHHCRHCGRLLCSKCSDKEVPILKYGLNKPVRVCEVCSDVLTIGPGAAI